MLAPPASDLQPEASHGFLRLTREYTAAGAFRTPREEKEEPE
jgi:hypothetical protein